MRSRWYHKPELHAPAHGGEGKRVSWIELFFDLIFVAALLQLGAPLSNDLSLAGVLKVSGHLVPMWMVWTGFTVYANRFNVDDVLHRTVVLATLFFAGVMAISSHEAITGSPAVFALSCAIAQALVASLYLRSWIQVPESRGHTGYWGQVFMVSAVFFAVSALVPVPYTYVPWALGLLAILTAPGSDPAIALGPQFPRDQEHLSERFGLLTLLVLGVSFGHVLTSLAGLGLLDPEILLKGALTLMLTVSLWWIYFDDVAGSDIAKGPGNWMLWLMGHLPLTLSIIGVGVAAKDAIHMDLVAPASEPSRWFLSGALATTLMSVALIDSVTTRENTPMNNRHRVFVRLGSALILLLLGAAGGTLSSGAFLAFVTAVCAVQSLIDMMFTPMDNTPETVRADSVTELYPQRRDGTRRTRKAPPKFSDVVRKGAPSHLRRDVYFFFIEGSWSRLLACFAFAFTCLNIFFACVYQLQPGSIGGDSNQSFADAFFFSVQTLSSLGYGAMSPATAWADMVVTIEAPTGMLFVALATGLIFAKASKPQSSVLFSESLVISRRNGVPTLMLRVANARGNDVADATMTVSALIEEVSPEGHHLRRLHDLKLVRDRSPIFSMTWLAMHELDENSPLKSHNIEDVLLVVVTLVGHDGTYGQTTFARHTYDPSDVRMGHRFVDVMSELPDGRMMIDLTRFHDTQQESTP